MWSLVRKKKNQRWVWQAIDHHGGQVLLYIFGRRQDTAVVQLKTLLAPCGIRRSHTDHWGTYTRHLDPAGRSPAAEYAADRAQTCDGADPDQATYAQDDLFVAIHCDAQSRHRVMRHRYACGLSVCHHELHISNITAAPKWSCPDHIQH